MSNVKYDIEGVQALSDNFTGPLIWYINDIIYIYIYIEYTETVQCIDLFSSLQN